MKRWLTVVLPILFITSLIWLMIPRMLQSARNASEDASRQALFAQVESDLLQHLADFDEFPSSLSYLQIRDFPDGSNPDTLNHFTYYSKGSCYIMSAPLTDNKRTLEASWRKSLCE